MAAAVPAVEVADHADPLGVRRPHGEAGAAHAVRRADVRAELVIDAPLIALAEEIQVRLAQCRQEGIRIARAPHRAGFVRDHQVIRIDAPPFFREALEDIRARDALQLEGRLILFMHRFHAHLLRPGQHRAHHQTRLVAEQMHAEEGVGRLMGEFHQTAEFIRRENHARHHKHSFPRRRQNFTFRKNALVSGFKPLGQPKPQCHPAAFRRDSGPS